MIGCFANAQSTSEQNFKERCVSGEETHFSVKFIAPNTGGKQITVYGFRNSTDETVQAALEQAKYGHVGFSFNTGKKTYGFGPHAPGLSGAQLEEALKAGKSFRGKLTNDTAIFNSASDLGLNVQSFTYNVSRFTYYKARVGARLQSTLPFLPGRRYSLPRRSGGFNPGCWNCATYPQALGLLTPGPTGQLRDFLVR